MKNFLYHLSLCLSIQNHILIIDEADIPEIQKACELEDVYKRQSLDSPKPTAEAVQENNQPLFHKLKKKGKPYMGFVVLHMENAHGSDSGTTAHIERFIIPKNATNHLLNKP